MTPSRKLAIGLVSLGAALGTGLAFGVAGTASAAQPATVVSVAATAATDDTVAADTATDTETDDSTRADEVALTGTDASSVEAAVLAANPGATIDAMETDADGAAFEAHITLADGSEATVKLDASFAITGTETGGRGGKGGHGGAHSAGGVAEVPLTGTDATSVEAAVAAASPGVTIDRMETDADGDAFEAHVTLADGSQATVKLDASFAVTATEAGGAGGHGGGKGGRGHGDHADHGDDAAVTTTDDATVTTDAG